MPASAYQVKTTGSKYSSSYSVYFYRGDTAISPWHDISLYEKEYVNCINEISRFEHAKFEINKAEQFNPIKQDVKKGEMRFIKNVYPFFGYPFNYGALPQTWEDPASTDKRCGANGDDDPLDVVDISPGQKGIGEVYKAKVLGALALIDDGEADWKIIVIDAADQMASDVSTLDDVRRLYPGLLDGVHAWFMNYKIPDGKPKNTFAFDGKFLDSSVAREIIDECHANWRRLVASGYSGISLKNGTLTECAECDPHFKPEISQEEDSPIRSDISSYYFVSQ